ncbi:molybdenum ABC transporter ATP-binding protein [Brevirhabdus sp.]|uniref:molybdenum ABC transporter ATP-binding protein n=1 Tax=Brevirhabdus sp. TaxID=2004514 RepID=UPI004059050E
MSLSVQLRHAFPGFALDVDFTAPPGVTALFGRSGSGKSTVVNAVAGLLRPQAGRIALDGRVLCHIGPGADRPVWQPPHRRHLGYVFQEGRLFPHLTVRQNLRYGRWFAARREAARPDRAEFAHVVEMLGIGALLERRPLALSGGEKQRVAIGRALLCRPGLLLMDEPLAALDEARKAEILPYLERLRDDTVVPILFVSHAMSEVARLATTVVVMDAGRVLRAGAATEILSDPAAVPLLGVREAGSLLTGRLLTHHDDGLTEVQISAGRLLLPHLPGAPGTRMRIRIEAQDVILSRTRPEGLSALNILPATVSALHVGQGPGVTVQLRAGEDLILARVTRRSATALGLQPGMSCFGVIKSVSVAQGDVGLAAAENAP